MLLNEIKPSPFLTEYVRLYRIIDFRFPDNFTIPCKVYPPRPEHCLQFFPKNTETTRYPDSDIIMENKKAIMMGQHCKVFHRYPGKEFLCIQIVFQPAGFHQITNIPSENLMNMYIDAEDIFGKSIQLVNEQLFHAKNYDEMIKITESFLNNLIRKNKTSKHPVDETGILMIKEEENFSIDNFLKSAYLSHRQFDRKFKERIGVPPKLFLQLSRFDKAFRLKNRFPQIDWLSIAIRCGYHDYQHLAKEYKSFTNFTPVQFFEIDNKAPERHLGDVET